MLNRMLPQNSARRRHLRGLASKANVALPARLRRNFTRPAPGGLEELRTLLGDRYFPSWFEGADIERFYGSNEGRAAFENHLWRRLELDRYRFVPWVDSVLRLPGATVLEIGCGTGSATVAMAEQGARVAALDLHRQALEVARLRADIHGVANVRFVQGNAEALETLIPDTAPDMIVFFAVLEHMTLSERLDALRAAWGRLEPGKYLCVVDTPNRLWFYDGHTSRLPFFHWLPDELAFEYSRHSPRYPFGARFRRPETEMLAFVREGRGVSFHELDVALGGRERYRVVSDQTRFLALRNPAIALKRLTAGDGRRERLLNGYAPDRHRAFFREGINVVLQRL